MAVLALSKILRTFFFQGRHIIHVGYLIYEYGVGLLWVRIGQNMIPGEMVN